MNTESDVFEVINCADDNEYGVFCEIFDKLCIEKYFKNHAKSRTHTNNFYKRQRLNKTIRKT